MTELGYRSEQRLTEKLTHPRMGFVPSISKTGTYLSTTAGVSPASHRTYRLEPTVVATSKGEVVRHQRIRLDPKPARSKKQRRLERAAAKAAMERPIEQLQEELGELAGEPTAAAEGV